MLGLKVLIKASLFEVFQEDLYYVSAVNSAGKVVTISYDELVVTYD
jgi:hypothetical protein